MRFSWPSIGLPRLLQLSVAGLFLLSSLLYAMGHHSPLFGWVALLVAAASFYLVDVRGSFHVPRQLGNFLSLVAVVIWFVKASTDTEEWQLVAVSYVLLILQSVLLLQLKTQRVYWQLVLLSVAQVAVASALTPGLYFALVLILFTVLGVSTLAMLLLQRELTRFGHKLSLVPVAPSVPVTMPIPVTTPATAGNGTWSAAGRPAIGQTRTRILFAPTVAPLPTTAWRHTLLRQVAAIMGGTLLTALVAFVLFPRSTNIAEAGPEGIARSVGFSREVVLGNESENIRQNRDIVLRAQFFSEPGGQPLQLIGSPLLRGIVVSEYTQGRWRQSRSRGTWSLERYRGEHYVRQLINIRPLEDATVFALAPAYALDDDDRIRLDVNGEGLIRHSGQHRHSLEYEVATTTVRDRRQMRLVPSGKYSTWLGQDLLQMPEVAESGSDPLRGLKATAESVRTAAGLEVDDRLGIARALEAHLRDSDRYQYSSSPPKRLAEVDPLEDFVMNNPRGQCEYFAGALAMMLRSQNIPARMAIGFRADEWNSAGGYYQVRQLHAHTWVEALLEASHIPPSELPAGERVPAAAWLTLDATPAGNEAQQADSDLSLWIRTRMYFDYLEVLWGKYVTGLTAQAQDEVIYRPLRRAFYRACDWAQKLFSGPSLLAAVQNVSLAPWRWYRQNWFSPTGALLGVMGAALLWGFYRTIRAVWSRWPARLSQSLLGKVGRTGSGSALLLRLERVLQLADLQRSAGETPHEFALAAAAQLATRPTEVPLATLPGQVVEAFYRIRFGGRALDKAEAEAVEHALSALEQGLR